MSALLPSGEPERLVAETDEAWAHFHYWLTLRPRPRPAEVAFQRGWVHDHRWLERARSWDLQQQFAGLSVRERAEYAIEAISQLLVVSSHKMLRDELESDQRVLQPSDFNATLKHFTDSAASGAARRRYDRARLSEDERTELDRLTAERRRLDALLQPLLTKAEVPNGE